MLFTPIKLTIISLLTVQAYGAIENNRNDSSCDRIGKVVIIVDRTVDDRGSLSKETEKVFLDLLADTATSKEKYLSTVFEQYYADDAGEQSANWTAAMPATFGTRSRKWKREGENLKARLRETLSQIEKGKSNYRESLLLESIHKQARLLGSCDKLFFISDLNVVDKNGNNFEKGTFQPPVKVNIKADYKLVRVPKKGQSLHTIKLIDAWWSDTLEGGNTFSKLKRTEKRKPSFQSAIQPSRKEITTDLEERNNWIISRTSKILEDCFSSSSPRRKQMLTILLDGKGKPVQASWPSDNDNSLRRCLWRTISKYRFVEHPKNKKYSFSAVIGGDGDS